MSAPKQPPTVFGDPGPQPLTSPHAGWGTWTVGDLRDAFDRMVDLIGPSTKIGWAEVEPPAHNIPFPFVRVGVAGAAASQKIRRDVQHGEYLSVLDDGDDLCWAAVVAGICLRVHVEGAH